MKTALVLLFVLLVAGAWASDRISLQGERTIFTVRCDGGAFNGRECSGRLVPAERYRFRALRNRNEVLFWVIDSKEPSGKYSNCTIEDRGNWSCTVSPGEAPTITYRMVDGLPQRGSDPATPGFHAVRKWKWYLMRWGVPLFRRADI